MRLTHVYFKNVLNFEELDMLLDNFNIFVGPNGAGKSNIMRVIEEVTKILQNKLDTNIGPRLNPLIRDHSKQCVIGLTFALNKEEKETITKLCQTYQSNIGFFYRSFFDFMIYLYCQSEIVFQFTSTRPTRYDSNAHKWCVDLILKNQDSLYQYIIDSNNQIIQSLENILNHKDLVEKFIATQNNIVKREYNDDDQETIDSCIGNNTLSVRDMNLFSCNLFFMNNNDDSNNTEEINYVKGRLPIIRKGKLIEGDIFYYLEKMCEVLSEMNKRIIEFKEHDYIFLGFSLINSTTLEISCYKIYKPSDNAKISEPMFQNNTFPVIFHNGFIFFSSKPQFIHDILSDLFIDRMTMNIIGISDSCYTYLLNHEFKNYISNIAKYFTKSIFYENKEYAFLPYLLNNVITRFHSQHEIINWRTHEQRILNNLVNNRGEIISSSVSKDFKEYIRKDLCLFKRESDEGSERTIEIGLGFTINNKLNAMDARFLSGGEKEVLILLSLIQDSSVGTIVLDEPLNGAHSPLIRNILNKLIAMRTDRTIIIVTHRAEFIRKETANSIKYLKVSDPTKTEVLNISKDWYGFLYISPIIFSRRVLFVEGETDKPLLDMLLEDLNVFGSGWTRNFDIYLMSPNVGDPTNGGAGNLSNCIEKAKELGIEWAAIVDVDFIINLSMRSDNKAVSKEALKDCTNLDKRIMSEAEYKGDHELHRINTVSFGKLISGTGRKILVQNCTETDDNKQNKEMFDKIKERNPGNSSIKDMIDYFIEILNKQDILALNYDIEYFIDIGNDQKYRWCNYDERNGILNQLWQLFQEDGEVLTDYNKSTRQERLTELLRLINFLNYFNRKPMLAPGERPDEITVEQIRGNIIKPDPPNNPPQSDNPA